MDNSDYERGLLSRVAAWPEHARWQELSAKVLEHVTARNGIDFATALVFDRLLHSPEHGPFIEHLQLDVETDETERPDATLAIVPGACYVEYPATGADGLRLRSVAESLGWRVEVVPVQSFGSLKTNAQIINGWLDKRHAERVILVSLSKGGADVKTALARSDSWHAFRNVAAWIDLSGIVYGTPLAAWAVGHWFRKLMVRLVCWCRNYDFSVLGELNHSRGGDLDCAFALPPWIRLIHVVAFPLSVHLVSKRARRGHSRLAAFGPNDAGGILLADVCRLPGLIYPVWGADHYLDPAWDIRPLIRRLLNYALTITDEAAARNSAQSVVTEKTRVVVSHKLCCH